MIPESGRSMINLHLDIARNTTLDDYAEDSLKTVEGMLSFACAVGFISPGDYTTELVQINLIRAQRKNRQPSATVHQIHDLHFYDRKTAVWDEKETPDDDQPKS